MSEPILNVSSCREPDRSALLSVGTEKGSVRTEACFSAVRFSGEDALDCFVAGDDLGACFPVSGPPGVTGVAWSLSAFLTTAAVFVGVSGLAVAAGGNGRQLRSGWGCDRHSQPFF